MKHSIRYSIIWFSIGAGFIVFISGCGNSDKATIERLTKENLELREKLEALSKEQQMTVAGQASNSVSGSAELQVKPLLIHQEASYTSIDFQIQNNSDTFISHWQIGSDIYDRNGQYLAHGMKNGENLRSGQTITDQISFNGVQSDSVAKWGFQIDKVESGAPGGATEDVTKYFQLKVLQ
jgi:hypothetical protein